MKREGTKTGKRVERKIQLIIAVMMCFVIAACYYTEVNAAKVVESTTDPNKQYTNIYSMYTTIHTTEGALWWKKDVTYTMSAKYNSAKLIMLQNLSGTKKWNGKNSDAVSLAIGISKQTTVSKTYSYDITGEVGFSVPLKAFEISSKLGGSYSNSATYEKTVGTNSVYTLNRSSQAGYYAVVSVINADLFDVSLSKDGKEYTKGKMLKYASPAPYERLYRKDIAF
ncbi:MAG: hypothetical protein K2M73_03960 [Lachnospiraceae bacterium]|nr:hypothetical protein [Lachnospiraceae bacterium]